MLLLTFTGMSLLLFAFVYWQTAAYERAQVDDMLRYEARLLASDPVTAEAGLRTWLHEDLHAVRYGLLTADKPQPRVGNMLAVPDGLSMDLVPRTVPTIGRDADGAEREDTIRAVKQRLANGRTLVLGYDTDELDHINAVIRRALGLGLLPMVALSLVAASLLGQRVTSKVSALNHALSAVRVGGLRDRLPVSSSGDEFDRVAVGVNGMLDEIGALVEEIQMVGDSIAHDLRTPLTRVRTRLESVRNRPTAPADYLDAIDDVLGWLDGTFEMITAVLRIGEIEHGRRRAAFAPTSLTAILAEAVELYAPLAEDKGAILRCETAGAVEVLVDSDRDLLFEAVGNLIENAIKFTPRHGTVLLSLAERDGRVTLAVADDGPGISAADRPKVLQRFFRGERSRHSAGNGLGLAFVAAVAKLHGFELVIGDNHPGCHVALHCDPSGADQSVI